MGKHINYRLGLNLSTNTIGWAICGLENEHGLPRPTDLVNMGVRVFSDGRNQKKEPLAIERREARQARKILHRRRQRRMDTFRLLQKEGFYPENHEEAVELKKLDPYELRAAALDGNLNERELGRVFFNLSVRRGFKSNRKSPDMDEAAASETNEADELTQKNMQENLAAAIVADGSRTLGEFLWKNKNKNGGTRFVPGRMCFYPTRKMYEDEFNAIRAVYEPKFPDKDWDGIFKAIFYQRPLKPQQRGACQFLQGKVRTYKAMPCSEKLRVLQDIRNLSYIDTNGELTELKDDEQDVLASLLFNAATVKLSKMKKVLGIDENCLFNLEKGFRKEIKGCPTAVRMRADACFGEKWDTLTLFQQDEIIERLFTAETDEDVYEFLSNKFDTSLSEDQKRAIMRVQLQSGTTMISREASEALVEAMESERLGFTGAAIKLGYNSAEKERIKMDTLPYYGKVLPDSTMGGDPSKSENKPEEKYGRIGNPTVHVALNQTRKVVNAIIKEYGLPTEINIEVAGELKNSREARNRIIKIQRENEKQNAEIDKTLGEQFGFHFPTKAQRLKLKLWNELGEGHRCLYCGKEITEKELFSRNIEIDFIQPFSRSLINADSNKTIAHVKCNAAKGNRTPFEAFGSNPQGFNWQEIVARAAANLTNMTKKARFQEKADDPSDPFAKRRLTDNAYLSKLAKRYLGCVCDRINAVPNSTVRLLYSSWKLGSMIKRKFTDEAAAAFGLTDDALKTYRRGSFDRRAAAVEAIAVLLADQPMLEEFSTVNEKGKTGAEIKIPAFPFAWNETLSKIKNITPSYKPDHGTQGKLSKETLLGKIKREEKIPIEKLSPEQIPNIKSDKVRNELIAALQDSGDLKKTLKSLRDVYLYPEIKIYSEVYVVRTPLTSLTVKNIKDIIDPEIRAKLEEFVLQKKDEKFENVVNEFSEKTGIRKVRCMNRCQIPIEIRKRNIVRYLSPDNYYSAEIWRMPGKNNVKYAYSARYIRRDEVNLDGTVKSEIRPHPAAKKICVLRKNDCIEFSINGKWIKGRVAGFGAQSNCIDIRPICAVTSCNDWLIANSDFMTEDCWSRTKTQNYLSVNVLFGERSARRITVDPIGKITRQKEIEG